MGRSGIYLAYGEYKLAAGSACTSLSAHIKSKADSHLNDRELAAQVFKSDLPAPTQLTAPELPCGRRDRASTASQPQLW